MPIPAQNASTTAASPATREDSEFMGPDAIRARGRDTPGANGVCLWHRRWRRRLPDGYWSSQTFSQTVPRTVFSHPLIVSLPYGAPRAASGTKL
jgi:hypothetical protein